METGKCQWHNLCKHEHVTFKRYAYENDMKKPFDDGLVKMYVPGGK
jgi:hypothetical protein